jgi:diadenosine tetraphosphate (Ap4A) HIT family hydrolase
VSRPGVVRNASHASTQRRPLGDGAGVATLGALVQFNEEHIKTKRPPSSPSSSSSSSSLPSAAVASPPQSPASGAAASPPPSPAALRVSRPFDGARFNFNRVPPAEVVASVRVREDAAGDGALVEFWPLAAAAPAPAAADAGARAGGAGASAAAAAAGAREHALLINANPLMPLHGLLVPAPAACHPQVMTAALLREAALVGAALGASGSGLRLGFNSLGAWASVNHFHLHVLAAGGMFPGGAFPLERAPRGAALAAAAGVALRRVVVAGALTGFAFEAAGAARGGARAPPAAAAAAAPPLAAAADAAVAGALAATAGAFLERLVARDTAHTVLLADAGATALVLPRALQRADADPAATGRLVVALAEICGYAIVYTADDFAHYAPADYARALADVALPDAELRALEAEAVACVRAC